MTVDATKLGVPVGVLATVILAGLSYWVNAQDTKIDRNATAIGVIKEDIAEDRLEVQNKINSIHTTQQVQINKQQSVIDLLQRLERKIDAQAHQ